MRSARYRVGNDDALQVEDLANEASPIGFAWLGSGIALLGGGWALLAHAITATPTTTASPREADNGLHLFSELDPRV